MFKTFRDYRQGTIKKEHRGPWEVKMSQSWDRFLGRLGSKDKAREQKTGRGCIPS